MIKSEINDGRWTAKIEAPNNVVDLDRFIETIEYHKPNHEPCEPFYMVTYANETCSIKIPVVTCSSAVATYSASLIKDEAIKSLHSLF